MGGQAGGVLWMDDVCCGVVVIVRKEIQAQARKCTCTNEVGKHVHA